MLGHRGCRLGNTFPEITEMQTKAILGACLKLKKKGIKAIPEIMVPLTGILYEFLEQEKVIRRAAKQLFNEMGDSIDYKVGTMIEIPRAALTANRIASAGPVIVGRSPGADIVVGAGYVSARHARFSLMGQ